jgi:hypothetical protein
MNHRSCCGKCSQAASLAVRAGGDFVPWVQTRNFFTKAGQAVSGRCGQRGESLARSRRSAQRDHHTPTQLVAPIPHHECRRALLSTRRGHLPVAPWRLTSGPSLTALGRKLASLALRVAQRLLNHAEESVHIRFGTCRKEQLIRLPIRGSAAAELNSPQLVNLDRIAEFILHGSDEHTGS